MRIKKEFILFMVSFFLWGACSFTKKEDIPLNEINVIPLPNVYEVKPGVFRFDQNTEIGVQEKDEELASIATHFIEKTAPAFGYRLKLGNNPKAAIQLQIQKNNHLGDEGYKIQVSESNITVIANRPHGVFNAMQTLYQLLPPKIKSNRAVSSVDWAIGCIDVEDKPAYPWRGLMLDVSRHFFTKKEVCRFIDQMSEYKYNVFHWHLTDDQGWRIEIKSRPQLTQRGAWRAKRVGNWWERMPQQENEATTYGGYYSQNDILEIVEYARQRYITIVPEIDVPGHSMAALTAYPELSCLGGNFNVNVGNTFYTKEENTLCIGNDETYRTMNDVLTEVVSLFPSEYIHMGGDECFGGFWEKCKKCTKCMKDKNLKNIPELQTYFMSKMAEILKKHNKKMIVWDEIVEGGLPKDAIVMSWRGLNGAIEATKNGHHVILTPTQHCYLDLYQGDPLLEPNTYSMLRLKDCYKFEKKAKDIDSTLILGAQGNLWTESIPHYRQVEYMLWPRALALSEAFWSVNTTNNWEFFIDRVENHFTRFSFAGTNYATSIYDPIVEGYMEKNGTLTISISSEVPDVMHYYTFDNTNPDAYSPIYNKPLSVPQNATMLKVITYRNNIPIGKQLNISIEEIKKRLLS